MAGPEEQGEKREIDARVLAVLVCPFSKHPLEYDAAAQELISRQAHLAFPIRDGVPILTLDAARRLDEPGPVSSKS